MTSERRRQVAKRNIKRAQRTWQAMSPRARAHAQPEGRQRAQPGSTGEGEYYHIEVRPKRQFTTFRTQDVGRKGGIQRVAGKRSSGTWDDQKWLISKTQAHVDDGKLIPDTSDAREVVEALGSEPVHVTGDRFQAKPRPNVPEERKPTPAQRRAQQTNIRRQTSGRLR